MLALLFWLLVPTNTYADPPGRAEFEEARQLFDTGDAARALPLFEKAYRLSNKRPSTILALALCERELKLDAQALQHLDEYLAAVPAEREKYAAIHAELEAKVSTVEVKPPPPPPPPPEIEAEPPPPAIVAPPPALEERAGPSVLQISLWASGGATFLSGVVFAVLAARAESDVKNRVEEGRGPASAIEDRAEEGFRFAVTADVLLSVGVVAAGAGFFVD